MMMRFPFFARVQAAGGFHGITFGINPLLTSGGGGGGGSNKVGPCLMAAM